MKEFGALNRRTLIKSLGASAMFSVAGSNKSFAIGQTGSAMKSRFDFNKVYNRTGVDSKKWDRAIKQYGSDKIQVAMAVADMDFKQFPGVIDVINKRNMHENYGYEVVSDSYYQSIIDWNRDRYGLEIKKEWIKNSSASKPGMVSAVRGINPPGGKVVILTPTYAGFDGVIHKAGMQTVMSPMKKRDNRWYMDLEDLESRLDAETKVLILCNPNNPSGECWTTTELRKLGDVCIRNGVTIISDELWADFVRDGKRYTPFASLGEKYRQNSVTLKSVSKSFSQASLKVAYLFTASEKLMEAIMIKGGHEETTNTFGRLAAETAYRDGAAWLDQVNHYIDGNYDYLVNYINTPGKMPGIKYTKPEGTYMAWLDCNGLKEKIATDHHIQQMQERFNEEGVNTLVTPEFVMAEWLIEHAGVQIMSGDTYGIGSDGFMRMNIALSRKHLELALDNISSALNQL